MIEQQLQTGKFLLLDGAIGTELEKHGIPEVHDASWAECMGTHAHIVERVHLDYVNAGADIITTNSYATGKNVLGKIGKAQHFVEWNQLAVELVKSAIQKSGRSDKIYIAGSVSAFGNGATRYKGTDDDINWGENDPNIIKQNVKEQISILVDAGVDYIQLEMLGAEIEDMSIALDAAKNCGVPVILALSCFRTKDDDTIWLQILDGSTDSELPKKKTLKEACETLSSHDIIALMTHHVEIDLVSPIISEIRKNWDGATGAYPNRTGYWDGKKWVFTYEVTPESYAKLTQGWIKQGAQIVGGCCGVAPEHIAAIRNII